MTLIGKATQARLDEVADVIYRNHNILITEWRKHSNVPWQLILLIMAHPDSPWWYYMSKGGNMCAALKFAGLDDQGEKYERVDFFIS